MALDHDEPVAAARAAAATAVSSVCGPEAEVDVVLEIARAPKQVVNGARYVTASAPASGSDGKTNTAPALYQVTLTGTTAAVTSVLRDDSTASDATNGKPVALNLSDPDSSEVMPVAARVSRVELLLDSQGDSEQVFLSHLGQADQSATVLKLNTQVDYTSVATGSGTLLVSDGAANQVIAVHSNFASGDVFTTIPTTIPSCPAHSATESQDRHRCAVR